MGVRVTQPEGDPTSLGTSNLSSLEHSRLLCGQLYYKLLSMRNYKGNHLIFYTAAHAVATYYSTRSTMSRLSARFVGRSFDIYDALCVR
jgi:hypothetical protein